MEYDLTASGANRIAKRNNEDRILKNILEDVKKKSQEGEFTLITREHGFGECSYSTGKVPDAQQNVISRLEQLGYKARMVVEEKQFLDIHLKIEW